MLCISFYESTMFFFLHRLEIPHIPGSLNNDLYAVPVKRRSHALESDLPPGWEKHEGKCCSEFHSRNCSFIFYNYFIKIIFVLSLIHNCVLMWI